MHYNKIKRDKLFKENSFCQFCGVEMIHPDEFHENINGVKTRIKSFSKNLLTIEHIYSRYNPQREEVYKDDNRAKITICCWECNQNNAKKDFALYGKTKIYKSLPFPIPFIKLLKSFIFKDEPIKINFTKKSFICNKKKSKTYNK